MIVVKKSNCVWSVRAAFTWLLLAHLAGCGRGSGSTNRLSLTTTVNDKVVGVTDLVFDNDTATTTTDGKVERFDLRDERWFDESRNKWITLAESRKWTENSIAQSRKTLEATPSTDTKPLMEWMISPRFDVTQEGDVLLLNSEFIHYRIKTAPGGPQLKNLLKYSRLNDSCLQCCGPTSAIQWPVLRRPLSRPPFVQIQNVRDSLTRGHSHPWSSQFLRCGYRRFSRQQARSPDHLSRPQPEFPIAWLVRPPSPQLDGKQLLSWPRAGPLSGLVQS